MLSKELRFHDETTLDGYLLPARPNDSAIELISLRFADDEFLEVRMLRVKEVIPFFNDDGRRNF